MSTFSIRNARNDDLDAMARLWYDGWQDAHADLLPEELRRARTLAEFRRRLAERLDAVRCVELDGAVVAFAMIKQDELYQFYVAAAARGTGIADALMQDVTAIFRSKGIDLAWLACAIGNDRAARFYERMEWRRSGIVTSSLSTTSGVFLLDVWRYELDVPPAV